MIFFLYGPDTYRSKEKLKAITNKFCQDVDNADNSLLEINGQKINLNDINQHIKAESLFSTKKMLIIKNVLNNKNTDFLEHFLNYLKKENIDDSHHVVIFFENNIEEKKLNSITKKIYNYLKKQKFVQEFKMMTPYKAKHWIKDYVSKYHKNIDELAINELINNLDTNLWHLKNELHKLCHLNKKSTIDLDLVKNNINLEIQENIFALTDALGRKDYKLATQLLNKQLQTEFSPDYILNMIRNQFQQIFQAKIAQNKGKTPNDISTELGLHPYVAKKSSAQARQFQLKDLEEHLHQLNKIEFNSRKKSINLSLSLQHFITKKIK